MSFAVFSDVHGHRDKLYKILSQIQKQSFTKVICTGDLIDVKISKKNLHNRQYPSSELADHTEELFSLVSHVFELVKGNQEQRFFEYVDDSSLGIHSHKVACQCMEQLTLEELTFIHGHRFEWPEHNPVVRYPKTPQHGIYIHGHHHRPQVLKWTGSNYQLMPLSLNKPCRLQQDKHYLVNVGPTFLLGIWVEIQLDPLSIIYRSV
ncbi:metallophosphoesterase family protein [Vibrio rhizosphaerae]|uniref:Metallophosphoesterase family protein n=1 Tax=Vibrio rhizosphaerae TaxID=398736 RepID=A0ABU4IS79_9VIBR|nr:metallophosphoesterase family protein [Vibrio rhizosphaerae]MDW6092144.1 metallophosphoesterase family protein [Vibrio rhizosphaerae]